MYLQYFVVSFSYMHCRRKE